jgi:2,4-dienoyl-CoA reductase-like NADH-dependent reductase (Old Yellow Enzyme family)
MISEGTVVSERGHGYPCTPGINTDEHVEAWKPIINAVHDKGAIFFCQLWHVGRASHQHYQPNEELPVSSSALAIQDGNKAFSLKTMQMEEYPVPRALELEEIPGIVEEFRVGAKNAIAAGFDGVEIHSANGKTC